MKKSAKPKPITKPDVEPGERIVYVCSQCDGKGQLTKDMLAGAINRIDSLGKEIESLNNQLRESEKRILSIQSVNTYMRDATAKAEHNDREYARVNENIRQLQRKNIEANNLVESLQRKLNQQHRQAKKAKRAVDIRTRPLQYTGRIPVHLL